MNATFLVCVPAQGAKEPIRRAEHESLRIGRTRDGNDIGLPGDKRLANHHCEFFYRDNAWHVRDLDTDVGTFVDGERIQETVLVGGSRVRFGVAEVVYTPDVEEVEKPTIEVVEDKAPRLYPPSGLVTGESDLRVRPVSPSGSGGGSEEDVPIQITSTGSGRRGRVREID